jgi:hypothetical protein
MLVPLKRKALEELVPIVSTSPQYAYHWGNVSDTLKRVLFSVVGIVLVWLLGGFLGDVLQLLLGFSAGLYWLWAPVYWATRRNLKVRKYEYCGFWRGQVFDVSISEELIGKEETVNQQGDLVIIENRERRLNLRVGDPTGFTTRSQATLRRNHQLIRPGDPVEAVVFSHDPDLREIARVSDLYFPGHRLWVSDYPVISHEVFEEISRSLRTQRRPLRRIGS